MAKQNKTNELENARFDAESLLDLINDYLPEFSEECKKEGDDRLILVRELLFDAFDVISEMGHKTINEVLAGMRRDYADEKTAAQR